MKYLILGLGIYGENLARDLTDSGNDVIGADINPLKVAELKKTIFRRYMLSTRRRRASLRYFRFSMSTL